MKPDDWAKLWQRRRLDLAALGLIVLFFLCFFGWIWSSGRLLVGGDAFLYSYPLRTIFWEAIRQGVLPLWTPSVLSGYPFLAMSQVAPAYPLTWGYLFLPGHRAEEIFVLAPFLLTPAFTYAYAREIGLSRPASLLAGLSFGYGGATINLLGLIGMPTNAQMWLPLFLIAIERSRTRNFAACLIGGTGVYLMSLLTGYAQSFVVIGLLAIAYAIFRGWRVDGPMRWQPLGIALTSIVAGGCLASFQILETLAAARQSVRSSLTFESFGEGSFTFATAVRSLIAPLYTPRFADVSTYVAPLVLLLAVAAVAFAFRRRESDPRIWFWGVVAVASWVLILGTNTPAYRIVYHLPVLNQFRVPSRHAFQWTFAVSILAACGWDALAGRIQPLDRKSAIRVSSILITACFVGAAVFAAVWWWRASGSPASASGPYNPSGSWYLGTFAAGSYLIWKVLFTSLSCGALWCSLKFTSGRSRGVLLASLLALVCFVEPYLMARHWWTRYLKEPARLTQPAAVTRWLLAQPGAGANRVYTRIQTAVEYAEEQSSNPLIDGPNLTALHKLQNVAGYEPLIGERYSRALGNVFLDSVTPRRGSVSDRALFDTRSHVLDLLSTVYVASYANLEINPSIALKRDAIEFAAGDLGEEIKPGATAILEVPATTADTLVLVTSLSHSVEVADDTRVAAIKVSTSDNRSIELSLRAGIDTAEWAHERADVRAAIKHRLAPIFDQLPGDNTNSFLANRYLTRLPLGRSAKVVRVEVTNLTGGQTVALWKASLFDSTNGSSRPVQHFDWNRWQEVYNQNGALVLRNQRALPRAWLVAEVESVDAAEALRRIRGESAQVFDPRRTALLEVPPAELPQLSGGQLAADSSARITSYQNNHLRIETSAATPTVLVVSEMFYSGWQGTIDGQPARIFVTDYLLRGVAVPAGKHVVEMRYRAPAARNGLIVSGVALVLLVAIAIYFRVVG